MRARTAVSRFGLAGIAIALSGASCNLFGTRITRDDCTQWTEHYRAVAKKVLHKDFAKCGMSDADIDKGGAAITSACVKNAGQPYLANDAKCYLAGGSLEDWKACAFGQITMFHGYENAVSAQRGFLEDLCAK